MSTPTAQTAQTAQTKMTTLTTDIDEAADLAELTAPTPPDHFGDWDTDPDPDDWGEELPAAQINEDLDEDNGDDNGDDEDDSGGFLGNDLGMSTIEYALGCVAAAALGALLYLVVTSDTVESALSGIFERALNTQ
ncbi:MAG: DUF4244 domain-containing protein [Corynebacterium variabile]|uniref:DUF4244 domain-containing protein n=1 Tax=Corynebacterium variabile TaxID=1727 RepID=UPI0026494ACB|nr:DUF4244 domain-containing protein [Corynebacterium variabile]MDN6843366.1 DUF4244 domain-containing protein [Corynebacterium variabile]